MQNILSSLMDELASTYEVERETVECAISCILASPAMRRITGAEFAEITEKGLIVYGRKGIGNLGTPKRAVLRTLTYELERRLQDIRTATEYDQVIRLHDTIVCGTIERKCPDGSLLVSLPITGIFGEVIDEHFAIYALRRQPPHERDTYRLGQTLQFHVENVFPVRWKNGVSAVVASLTRTSRTFPAMLLAQSLPERRDIRCVKRVVGKISYIKATERIPRESILKVGKELNERIKVELHVTGQRQELRRTASAN